MPRAAATFLLAASVAAAPALACTICIDPPERTTVDHVVAARDVVLAREDPARPFRFAPVEVLRGSAEGPPVPFLVDSTLRRRLAAEPDTAVLFTRGAGSGGWKRLRVVSPVMRPILDDVLARGHDWLRPSGARERFEAFAALHDHADPAVRSLALAELDRTPWRLLRTLEMRLPGARLRASLGRPSELPWTSVRLRLLALDPGPEDVAFLRARLDGKGGAGGALHLDALAIAIVEIDGTQGIDRLLALYGSGTDRSREERAAIAKALATHGTDGDPGLRDDIAAALGELLSAEAGIAPEIAVALAAMRDWSAAERFATLADRNAPTDPADAFAVAAYLALARAAAGPTPAAPRPRHPFDLAR